MREPLAGVPAADVHDPLAEDRAVDERVHPHRAGNPWMTVDERSHFVRGNEGKFAPGQRLDVVVGNVEERALKVDEVARHMDADDLPGAFGGEFVAIAQAWKADR